MRMSKGKPFMDVPADTDDLPVFSEAFLYDRIGKGDARFVLGIAEEYEHVIDALGPEAVRALLDVKPRLVQRLGTGKVVTESLEDARSEHDTYFDKKYPPQIILDRDAARDVWQLVHNEYCRYFEPEKTMDRDVLRAYHTLTNLLGADQQAARTEEQARLPEKLERQRKRKEALPRKQEARKMIREALADNADALKAFEEVYNR